MSFSIICVTETWLSKNITNNEILPRGYNIYRSDRNSRGGGVFIAVSQDIPSHQVSISCPPEVCVVELLTSPSVLLCCIYLSPNSDALHRSKILSFVDSLSEYNQLIIMGDLNSPDINWSTLCGNTSFSNSLCNIIFSLNLVQLVEKPTHIKGNILDIVLTNMINKVVNLDVDVSSCRELSDHHLVIFDMVLSFSKHLKFSSGVFNYAKADFEAMSYHILDRRLFDSCLKSTKVHSMWCYFKEDLKDLCDRFVPKFNKHVATFPVWFTPAVRHQIKCTKTQRRLARRRPIQYRLNKLYHQENYVRSLISASKLAYEEKLVNLYYSAPRELYGYLKHQRSGRSTVGAVTYNSTTVLDHATQAEVFNKFFNSTFTRSSFTLPSNDGLPFVVRHLSKVEISTSDVSAALRKLDSSKALGCDNISPVILKHCITLLEPITHLLRSCLLTCVIPDDWKIHKIIPVHKKGDPSDVKNYRPISLLCVLAKLLEEIVHRKIIDFLSPLISSQQFGFMKHRSCLSQLLTFLADIYQSVDCT